MDRAQTILAYHEATKHHFHQYARSAGYMDWRNQPNPFRTYEGLPSVPLIVEPAAAPLSMAALHGPAQGDPRALDRLTLSIFLAHSLALSAWKAAGPSRWSLRINPSSGNLHPTECYLMLPALADAPAGIYHYNAFDHTLTRRIDLADTVPAAWAGHYGGAGFAVALSSIPWRESWKYGERAFRYCQLDAGHAVAALRYAARLNGWQLTCLTGAGDDQISAVLGFDRTPWHPVEAEHPEMICWVSIVPSNARFNRDLPNELVAPFSQTVAKGSPNRLSAKAVDWEIIGNAVEAVQKTASAPIVCQTVATAAAFPPPQGVDAARTIRKRRSAVDYNPGRAIPKETFFSILDSTLPRSGAPPFDAAVNNPAVHLLVFVHRVSGVAPGLYFFVRSGQPVPQLQSVCDPQLLWRQVRPDLPLYLLRDGDVTYDAMEVSCHQEIAGHSAFALAMLAPLEKTVVQAPHLYRNLHWECGMIGQVLYLLAEAHGIRGTGIGCFFDDPVGRLLGITDNALQSLYHFTVGHPVEDHRLQTLPAYHHLSR